MRNMHSPVTWSGANPVASRSLSLTAIFQQTTIYYWYGGIQDFFKLVNLTVLAQFPSGNSLGFSNELFGRSGHIANLVQISNIDRNRNVGRVPVIQEMFQSDLHRNRRDHLAKTRHL